MFEKSGKMKTEDFFYNLHKLKRSIFTPIAYLKPDFDLSLGEVEQVCDLYPSPARQVVVVVELLLELQGLEAAVGLAASAARTPAGS